jgi:hypothetical protein
LCEVMYVPHLRKWRARRCLRDVMSEIPSGSDHVRKERMAEYGEMEEYWGQWLARSQEGTKPFSSVYLMIQVTSPPTLNCLYLLRGETVTSPASSMCQTGWP